MVREFKRKRKKVTVGDVKFMVTPFLFYFLEKYKKEYGFECLMAKEAFAGRSKRAAIVRGRIRTLIDVFNGKGDKVKKYINWCFSEDCVNQFEEMGIFLVTGKALPDKFRAIESKRKGGKGTLTVEKWREKMNAIVCPRTDNREVKRGKWHWNYDERNHWCIKCDLAELCSYKKV